MELATELALLPLLKIQNDRVKSGLDRDETGETVV